MNRESWAPLTGVAFVVLVIIGFLAGGEPPEADSDAAEIVEHYVDNEGAVIAGALIVGIAATFFVFFGGYLRKVLSAAEGEGGILSAVAFAGAVILATGAAIDSTISFALADLAEEIDPTSVQALQALWENDFVPLALGNQVFLLASGISIVRHAALPTWLGWVAIVLAITALTPIGFAAFIGGGIWVLIVSVMLTMREREAAPSVPPPAAPPPTAP
jgi:hypothetical protein